jgi:type IV secretion system protein VirB1
MDLPIAQCGNGVDAAVVTAIVAAESGGNPWAINVNVRDGQVQPLLVPARSRDEAAAQAQWLVEGGYSIDVGLMQVNSANVARLGVSLDAAFDVCTNLDLGTTVFNEFADGVQRYRADFASPSARLMATLSAYNTGSYWKGFANGYVYRVMRFLDAPSLPADVAAGIVSAPMEVALDYGSDLVQVQGPFSDGPHPEDVLFNDR